MASTYSRSKVSWRKWYVTYKGSKIIKVFPIPQPESDCAREAVAYGERMGLKAIQIRAADTIKR